ncbi:MAG: sterol desaturase family protein, partial [Alphaproteobacteria bacterium]|nr:sterol desaturase family protein [Alphaproteobacteria bacterium]
MLRLSVVVVPALAALAATYAEGEGWGLLPALGIHGIAAAVVAFLVLDLAIYAQHVAFHFVPAFWRLHRVHHADTEFDVTTGVRFHAGEIFLSQVWKIAVVLALGAPAVAVLVFGIVLNATAMFNHSNLRLPDAVDRRLRLLTVTPDMHRVHHSIAVIETNSNFGFNFPFWDRMFGTYRAASLSDQASMPIGLASYRGAEPSRLWWLMVLPFVREPQR